MKKKLVKILCLILTLCALTAFAVSSVLADDGVLFEVPTLSAAYKVGDVLEVEDIKAHYGEDDYDTTSMVVFPDGLAYDNDLVYLSQVGTYTIRYSAKIANKNYYKDYTFSVKANKSILIEEKNATTYMGYASYYPTTYGLNVNSNASGTVFLKDPINIRAFSKTGNPLIELLAVPSAYGVKDFQAFNIHLIDTADENNEVIFQFTHLGDMGSLSYARGKAPNQIFMGLENGRPTYIQAYGGNKVNHSFWGLPDKNTPEDADKYGTKIDKNNPNYLKLYYDDSEKAAYTYESTGAFALVTDFDNPEYYGNVWGGFKSDYVKIGVSIVGAVGSPKYLIKTMGGIDFKEPENIKDYSAPLINIKDYANQESGNPKAKVGVPYKMFDVEVYDNIQIKELKREVRYNSVDGVGGTSVPYSNDYTFIPTRAGEYTITYKAEDLYGNVTTASVVIEAFNELDTFEVVLETNAESIHVYEFFNQRAYSIVGGSGVNSIQIYAENQETGEKLYIAKEKNRIITPGTYNVKYVAKDYNGYESTKSYVLTVNNYTTPFLVDDIFMPTAFVSGTEYEVPTKNAKFLEGNTYKDVKPVISAKLGGSSVAIKDGKFTPVSTTGGTLELSYKYTYGNAEKTYTYDVPVVNVGKNGSLDMRKYFVPSSNMSITSNILGIDLTATETGASAGFVKTLSSKKFELLFNTVDTIFDNVDFIEILLFDGIGEVSLKLYSDGVAKINDTVDAVYDYESKQGKFYFTVGYLESSKALRDMGSDNLATIRNYRDGSEFTGFSNEKIGFKVQFGTVKTEAELRITFINNQKINFGTKDDKAPQFSLDTRVGGLFERNDRLVLYPIVAWDVLGEVKSATVTVTDLNGNIVTATNGVRLDGANAYAEYTFIGRADIYTVNYSIIDTNSDNNETTEVRKYTCTTADPFSIGFGFGLPSKAKVGDEINLPEKNSPNYQAFYYVIDPNGDIHAEEVSYTFKKPGKYIIRLFGFNNDYNMSYVDHTIVVE